MPAITSIMSDLSKSFRSSNIARMASSDPRSAKGREVELLVRCSSYFSFIIKIWSLAMDFSIAFSPGAQRILEKCWQLLDRAVHWVLGRRTRYSLVV